MEAHPAHSKWILPTLDFIIRILLRHCGCLLWTSPKGSTVSGLEFNIASVSARSVLNDSSFNDLPCVFKRGNKMVNADQIYLSQTSPMWLNAGGFLCQVQYLPGEACDYMHTHHHTPKSIYMYENLYVQIIISNIALYTWKLSSQ